MDRNTGHRFLEKIEKILGRGSMDGVRHSNPDLCDTQGCPVKVTYQEILVEEPHGWLFVVDNLFVWLDRDQVQLNRDDQTVQLKLCDACEKGLEYLVR